MERVTQNSSDTQIHCAEQPLHSEEQAKSPFCSGVIILISGAVSPVLGSLLIAASWMIGDTSSGHLLHRVGSILLISTIPLLVISAFCLDAYEKRGGRVDLDW